MVRPEQPENIELNDVTAVLKSNRPAGNDVMPVMFENRLLNALVIPVAYLNAPAVMLVIVTFVKMPEKLGFDVQPRNPAGIV